MKNYMQPGEYSYFATRKIRCKEVTPEMASSGVLCNQCCLKDSFICYCTRCRKRERPDGKDVIFVYTKKREKK